jgi:hypothetical protein
MSTTEPFTYPTAAEVLEEAVPLVDAIPVYGPPVLLIVGPWLLFALLLAGPFALLVTFVVLAAAAAAVLALVGAILAAPFVLVRHLRGHRAARRSVRAPARPIVAGVAPWSAT